MCALYPVILSGGAGTRLWPLSRRTMPKQFIPNLVGEGSLFGRTLARANRLESVTRLGRTVVVCNRDHERLVAEELARSADSSALIILEPAGRNTAPAVALAANAVIDLDPEGTMLVLASDHVIHDEEAFVRAVALGAEHCGQDALVTFGIIPTRPETGYGYIRQGEPVKPDGYRIAEFREKPDLATAEQYLSWGGYLWNSGMFMFKGSVFLEELKKYSPDIAKSCADAWAARAGKVTITPGVSPFEGCRSDSIDYAVMEQTRRGVVVSFDGGWSDAGAWDEVFNVGAKDVDGNVFSGDVIAVGSSDNLVVGPKKLISLVGVEGLAVVDTPDALLVGSLGKCQLVRKVVDALRDGGRNECDVSSVVKRPWGEYELIDRGEGFLVKRIRVAPAGELSLQLHQHRSEQWTIVRGSGLATIGDDKIRVNVGSALFIGVGEKHRVLNDGDETLEFVEVQLGERLEEEDIVRFEDRYGRAGEAE